MREFASATQSDWNVVSTVLPPFFAKRRVRACVEIRTLFPYTTLFRSQIGRASCRERVYFMLLDLPDADVIVSTEALEHYHDQAGFVRRLAGIAKRGCALILTCAAPDRGAHSCDGGQLHDGEFYRNPDPQHVLMWLMTCGWRIVIFDHDKSAGDLRVMAFYEPAD